MIRSTSTSSPLPHPVYRVVRNNRRVRQPGFDDLGMARCPICNAPMIACMTSRGPAFVCQCKKRRERQAA
jgi:hypothetical protein